ncbi:MAG: peptidylprolyl isomerase [Eubacteriales bacterium]|nr:peptidylprolyl isomerase [Eubacteriales bacterium]
MENCKFCNQELDEGKTVCPHCGRDNAQPETPAETPVEETPVKETPVEEAPVEEAAQPVKKATPGKIALAVGAVVVLVAVLVALILAGIQGNAPAEAPADTAPAATEETVPATVPPDGNPDDATAKGTYTVTGDEALAARETVVATIGDSQLTSGQLQAHYWSTVNSFLSSQQGYFLMMNGALDYSKPLDTQKSLMDENMTWQQSFLQQALSNWQTSVALAAEAEKANLEMSDEEREYLDNLETYLTTTAGSYGMTLEELLRANLGPGATLEDFAAYQELYSRGSGYYAQEVAKFVPTQEELKAFYDAHAEDYAAGGVEEDAKMVDVRHILVTVKGEEGAEEHTEEEWEACRTEAQFILDTWLDGAKTEDSFAALANEKSEDPGSNTGGGLYEKVMPGQMVEPFEDWCFDESRAYGDYGLVKTDYGYHVMFFVGSKPQWQYYAENDWRTDKINTFVQQLQSSYPMEVDYSKIVLGLLDSGEAAE